MLRDTMIDNNWWYTECQATYNIRSIDSSNAIIQFTRIYASLVGGNKKYKEELKLSSLKVTSNKASPLRASSLT